MRIKWERRKNKPHTKKRPMILWGGLFFVTLVFHGISRLSPGFAEWYARYIYPLLVGSVGRLASLFPFSVSEMLLVWGLVFVLFWLVRLLWLSVCQIQKALGKKEKQEMDYRWKRFWMRSGQGAVRLLLVVFALFTFQCGINYHRQTFSQRAGLVMAKSTREELEALCRELTEQVNQAAERIAVDERGACVAGADVEERARKAMRAAAEEYPELAGYYPRAKAVWNSWALSYQQLLGIYSPFTIEANYNRDMLDYNKPSSICHELSHLRGFMREDEANFISYLACKAAKDPEFDYSGSLMAYIYSMNALYQEDVSLYREIRGQLCQQANRELSLHNAFWEQYEGPVAEASDKMNDTYLKANAQEDGTKSYGRMVDLLLALRRTQAGERDFPEMEE